MTSQGNFTQHGTSVHREPSCYTPEMCTRLQAFDLATPVNCVVCWTRDGKASGGTGQAMRFAEYLEIPIFNLYSANALDNLAQFVYDTEVAAQQPKPANG